MTPSPREDRLPSPILANPEKRVQVPGVSGMPTGIYFALMEEDRLSV